MIQESYITDGNKFDNVDSLIVWHGPKQDWIIATAKHTNSLFVYEAKDGTLLRKIDDVGVEMNRPNGIALFPDKDLLVIVERDGHKAQLLTLPDFKSILTFGDNDLIRPYGAAIQQTGPDSYNIFITDNYMDLEWSLKHNAMKYKKVPPAAKLNKRVHQYSVSVKGNGSSAKVVEPAKLVEKFGETSGRGVLHIVESIMIDEPHSRILIADEHKSSYNIKIYDAKTKRFTGHLIGQDQIFKNDPEGFVIYYCPEKSRGFYIFTEQLSDLTKFHIFDRQTLKYQGTFTGTETKKTDGVAITQQKVGNFKDGLFFAVHDDSKVSAFSLTDIIKTFDLKC